MQSSLAARLLGLRSPSFRHVFIALPGVVAVAVVFWLVVDRMTGAQMREPLLWDEIISLENYSWAAFRADGLAVHADRVEDLLPGHRPSGIQFVAGIYRAISVWREPNNHLVHSVLLNLSTALYPGSEIAVRLPAWTGTLIFAVGLALLAWRNGYRLAWPVALLIGASWPYIHTFSLQARGYSWMLALQVILLLLLTDFLPRRTRSIALGSVCGFVAILSFWNTISLIIDWLVPLYLALWLATPPRREPGGLAWNLISADERQAYRQNLVVQVLVLVSFAALFVVHFLPYVIVSAQEYGVPARGFDFFRLLADIFRDLFPNLLWGLVGIAGVIGWYIMWSDDRTRYLGLVCILTTGVSLAHFLVTQKLPYARTCGYFLPLVTLGATHLIEIGLRRVSGRLQPILSGIAVVGVSALVLVQNADLRSTVSDLVGFRQGLQREFVNDRPYITSLDLDQGWQRRRHVPHRYLTAYDKLERVTDATHLAFLVTPGDRRSMDWAGDARWPKINLPDRFLQACPATSRVVEGGNPPTRFPSLVVWVPASDRQEIRNELLNAAIDGLKITPQLYRRAVFMKWEFAMQVHALEFLIRGPTDYQDALEALRRGRETLRGKALLIEPQSSCSSGSTSAPASGVEFSG